MKNILMLAFMLWNIVSSPLKLKYMVFFIGTEKNNSVL